MDIQSFKNKKFTNYLREKNITKCYISSKLEKFNRILYIYNLDRYNIKTDKNKNVLFFGVYNFFDITKIQKHRGDVYVLFFGSDCDNKSKIVNKNIDQLKNYKYINYIAINKCIENRLKNIYKLSNVKYLENDLIDINIFYKNQNNINNNSILIYDGYKKDDKLEYINNLYNKLVNIYKNKYKFIRTSEIKNEILYENKYSFYNKFFMGIKLTKNDNNFELINEFKKINKALICYNKCNDIYDITEYIDNISYQIENKKKNNLNIIINENISINAFNFLLEIYNELKIINIYINYDNNKFIKGYSFINNEKIYNLNELKEYNNIFNYTNEVYNNQKYKKEIDKCYLKINNNKYYFRYLEKLYLKENLNIKKYEINKFYNRLVRNIFNNKKYINDLFSIIIPIYNSEKTIINTLNSIYQSNIKNINFEVIIVNDKSTDKSIENIKNYKKNKKYKNLKIINNKKNYGTFISINTGIFNSNGEFILILNSDDLITENRLNNDYYIFKNNNKIECINSLLIKYKYEFNNFKIDKEYLKNGGIFDKKSITYKRHIFSKNGFFIDNRFDSNEYYYEKFIKKSKVYKLKKLGYKSINYISKKNNISKIISLDNDFRKYFKYYYNVCLNNNLYLKHSIIFK